MKKILLPILILLCICPAIVGLLHPGFFLTDDGNSMIIRFSAFYEALRHGQFPVRFLPRLNFGYGYPVADFLYPLFMYIGVPIKVIGFHFFTTIKIILGLSIIFSGIFSFLWLKKIYTTPSAFVGAIVCTLFPYHLWDVYKRGSVGEVLALAVIPFIFWQIERKSITLSAIGLALLILAHNILALLFFPMLFVYMVLTKKYSFQQILGVFLLGLGSAAFFWIPALLDRKYTIFDQTIVAEFGKYFLQPVDYTLFGIIFLITLVVSFYGVWKSKKIFYWIFWLGSLFSVLLTLPFSQVFWKYIPITNFIQFPFRLLSITTIGIGFLAAVSVETVSKKYRWIATGFFIIITYVSAYNYFLPKIYQNYPDTFYSTNEDSTTIRNEYMPIWVHVLPGHRPTEQVDISPRTGVLSSLVANGTTTNLTVQMMRSGIVQLNTVYFPGWEAKVDGQQQKISYNNPYGLIQIPVQKGNHTIRVIFTETRERILSDILSVFSLLAIGSLFIWKRKKYVDR